MQLFSLFNSFSSLCISFCYISASEAFFVVAIIVVVAPDWPETPGLK
jgi:hypothetical protein